MTDPLELARTLAEARRLGRILQQYPGLKPVDSAAAYTLQREVSRALGWRQHGYKVGCTSLRAQRALATDRPFLAPLFTPRVFDMAAFVPTEPEHLRVVEPEIAFVMGAALGPRAAPYAVSEVLAAVSHVHASLEIVSPRMPNGLANPIEWLIADGGVNDAFVLGPGVPVLAASAYAAIRVEARVNGQTVGTGVGANALGGAEQVLVWVANQLNEHSVGLAPGDVVTTGLLTEIFRCAIGDRVEASFEGIGSVSASF
jgi:2-keto-4-pentenoate hydratase